MSTIPSRREAYYNSNQAFGCIRLAHTAGCTIFAHFRIKNPQDQRPTLSQPSSQMSWRAQLVSESQQRESLYDVKRDTGLMYSSLLNTCSAQDICFSKVRVTRTNQSNSDVYLPRASSHCAELTILDPKPYTHPLRAHTRVAISP